MPAAKQASRSSGSAFAVIAMMRGRRVGRPPLADPARGVETVELRHLHVHQHDVVGLPLERVDRLETVRATSAL